MQGVLRSGGIRHDVRGRRHASGHAGPADPAEEPRLRVGGGIGSGVTGFEAAASRRGVHSVAERRHRHPRKGDARPPQFHRALLWADREEAAALGRCPAPGLDAVHALGVLRRALPGAKGPTTEGRRGALGSGIAASGSEDGEVEGTHGWSSGYEGHRDEDLGG